MPDPNQPLSSTPKTLGDTTNVPPVVVEEKPPAPPIGSMSPPPPAPMVGNVPPPPPPTTLGAVPPPPPPSVIGGLKPKKKIEKSVLEPAPDKKDKKLDKKVEPIVFPPGGKPKKKKGKIIATILVLLVLVVGGVSATILVRQQQDIRERADVHECTETCTTASICSANDGTVIDGVCSSERVCCKFEDVTIDCASTEVGLCGGSCSDNERCTADVAGSYKCVNDYSCTQDPDDDTDPSTCTNPGSNNYFDTTSGGISVLLTQAMFDYCTCLGKSGVKVSRFQCSGQTMPAGGCQQGGQVDSFTSLPDEENRRRKMADDCGPQQLDVGCIGGGSIQGVSAVNWPAKCGGGGNGNGDNGDTTLTCQCIEIKAFDSEDTELTAEDLANLAVGDVVKFAVRGSASSGAITRARFTINETLGAEITGKQEINGVSYYVETYTIPDDATTFSIKAELYHPTAGWF